MTKLTSTLNATLNLTDRDGPTAIVCGKAGAVRVNVSRFSPEIVARVFEYGLKQLVNDAGATGKTASEKLGLINKRLEAMYAGTYGQRASASPRAASDPVGAEALRIARDMAKQRHGIRPFESDDARKQWTLRFAAQPSTRELAEAAVAARAGLDFDVDLD